MPYFSTYLGHISREETRCHISSIIQPTLMNSADMMSFRAGIANLFAPSKKESIFTGIMNMPMKHIAVFIIISPMKRDEVMAHNYMLAAVGDFLYRCDILKIPFGGLTEFSGIMIAANQNFSAVEPFKKGWPL